ncbi:MAG: hypothetical protein KAS78_00135, partial [Candidatus Pacebacteria bacterium]|nr:hypothetical protein [Candidatus Paceibacterota bacterium]
MENSNKNKLINLRKKEEIRDGEVVPVRKIEKQFFQKQENFESVKTGAGLKSKFLNKVSGIFDKAIRYLIYFLVFSLPILVLPFTVEIFEFNKTILLFIVSSLAFFIWIAKMVLVEKRLIFVRTPLDIPIVIFLSVILISTVFSVDKVSSILGFYGRFSDSLMVYLSLAMVYFTAVNVAMRSVIANDNRSEESRDDAQGIESRDPSASLRFAQDDRESIHSAQDSSSFTDNLIKAFLASAFVIVMISLFYFFGLKFIPWNEAQFRSFNLVSGSLNVLAIYLVSVVIIALGSREGRNEAVSRLYKNALIIMSLILLILIDFVLAWVVLAVSLLLVLVLGIASKFHSSREPAASHSEAIAEESRDDAQGIELRDPIASLQDDRKNTFLSPILIFLVALIFIASSLTFINKDIQTNFSSSVISDSVRDKLVDGEDNVAKEGFTREIIIEKQTAISIAIEGAKQDPIAGIIGSGPGTYLYNFSKFKPSEFNNSAFWNIRFDKTGSEVLEKVSTIGIFGMLSYLLIVLFTMMMFLKTLLRVQTNNKNV